MIYETVGCGEHQRLLEETASPYLTLPAASLKLTALSPISEALKLVIAMLPRDPPKRASSLSPSRRSSPTSKSVCIECVH